MADEPTGVVITFKDMYDEMRKLVVVVQTLTQELKESRDTDRDHERRIRVLERWMWGLPVSIVAAIAAAIKAFLT